MEKQKKWSRLMIGAVLVLILAIGGTAVLAQSQDEPDTTPAVPNPFFRGEEQARPNFGEQGQARPDFGGRHGFPGKNDHAAAGEDLAEALGISVEELQAAQEAAQAAALAQAVDEGLLTQEQADQLSGLDGRSPRGGHIGPMGNLDELLADELGISVETLEAAQETARAARLAQMVEDGVLTQEQADLMAARRAVNSYLDVEGLNEAIQVAFEAAVTQALEAGEITQDQADQFLSETPGLGEFGGHGRFGGRGGHAFPGGNPGLRGGFPGGNGAATLNNGA